VVDDVYVHLKVLFIFNYSVQSIFLQKHQIKIILTTRDRCNDFLHIFADFFGENLAFLTQNKANLCKMLIITLVFEKNANFFAENYQKSQKNVIITLDPCTQYNNEYLFLQL
jgi:hypothetical protein